MQIYTDGSKVDEKVAAAAVSSVAPNSPFSCRLRDHCSIYTAELQAILFALKQVYQSKEKKFIILSDLLSALQIFICIPLFTTFLTLFWLCTKSLVHAHCVMAEQP